MQVDVVASPAWDCFVAVVLDHNEEVGPQLQCIFPETQRAASA